MLNMKKFKLFERVRCEKIFFFIYDYGSNRHNKFIGALNCFSVISSHFLLKSLTTKYFKRQFTIWGPSGRLIFERSNLEVVCRQLCRLTACEEARYICRDCRQ